MHLSLATRWRPLLSDGTCPRHAPKNTVQYRLPTTLAPVRSWPGWTALRSPGWLQTAILSGKRPSAADVGPEPCAQFSCHLRCKRADRLPNVRCAEASVAGEELPNAGSRCRSNSAGRGSTEQADKQCHHQQHHHDDEPSGRYPRSPLSGAKSNLPESTHSGVAARRGSASGWWPEAPTRLTQACVV